MAFDPNRPSAPWPAETPDDHFHRYLRETPPAPRVVPRQSLFSRAVMFGVLACCYLLLGAICVAILRGVTGWP